MDPRGPPITFFLLLLFPFQVARADDPKETPTDLTPQSLGSSVSLPFGIPKGIDFSDISLHSASRSQKEAVALWTPGQPLTVVSPSYAGRVSFLDETDSFQIHNLTMEDGGIYDILLNNVSSFSRLKQYTLFVFSVRTTENLLSNGSCSLELECQAGAGSRGKVTYSWKHKETGVTLSQNSWLHLVMSPKNKGDFYTCTAQHSAGAQRAWDVAPYRECIAASGPAGPFGTISKAVFAPAVVALLMLL
ncbi:SLAM family member 9 [Rhineura floridana]|uniref:SLAM family member 9 n=1 Tax=Rhineura floridana TaxID=261503 RepID=UPI002AC811E2|nr:SLAM family member 9 [Rhineura floridana]